MGRTQGGGSRGSGTAGVGGFRAPGERQGPCRRRGWGSVQRQATITGRPRPPPASRGGSPPVHVAELGNSVGALRLPPPVCLPCKRPEACRLLQGGATPRVSGSKRLDMQLAPARHAAAAVHAAAHAGRTSASASASACASRRCCSSHPACSRRRCASRSRQLPRPPRPPPSQRCRLGQPWPPPPGPLLAGWPGSGRGPVRGAPWPRASSCSRSRSSCADSGSASRRACTGEGPRHKVWRAAAVCRGTEEQRKKGR